MPAPTAPAGERRRGLHGCEIPAHFAEKSRRWKPKSPAATRPGGAGVWATRPNASHSDQLGLAQRVVEDGDRGGIDHEAVDIDRPKPFRLRLGVGGRELA